MKPRWIASLFLFPMFLGVGESSAYCVGSDKVSPYYDPNYYSLSYEFRRAQYVVEARVLSETPLGEDGKRSGGRAGVGTFYDVQVEKVFKGRLQKRTATLQ
jgi:hypothetical protein